LRINAPDTPEQLPVKILSDQPSLSDKLSAEKNKKQKTAQAAYDAYVKAENNRNNPSKDPNNDSPTRQEKNTQNTSSLNKQDAIGLAVNQQREKEMRDEAAKQEMMNDEINPFLQ
jgi:hypothetical protein